MDRQHHKHKWGYPRREEAKPINARRPNVRRKLPKNVLRFTANPEPWTPQSRSPSHTTKVIPFHRVVYEIVTLLNAEPSSQEEHQYDATTTGSPCVDAEMCEHSDKWITSTEQDEITYLKLHLIHSHTNTHTYLIQGSSAWSKDRAWKLCRIASFIPTITIWYSTTNHQQRANVEMNNFWSMPEGRG